MSDQIPSDRRNHITDETYQEPSYAEVTLFLKPILKSFYSCCLPHPPHSTVSTHTCKNTQNILLNHHQLTPTTPPNHTHTRASGSSDLSTFKLVIYLSRSPPTVTYPPPKHTHHPNTPYWSLYDCSSQEPWLTCPCVEGLAQFFL